MQLVSCAPRVFDSSHVTVPSVPLSPSAPTGLACLVFLYKVFGYFSTFWDTKRVEIANLVYMGKLQRGKCSSVP